MGVAKRLTVPEVTDMCFTMTSRAMCSKCDADISTGQNPNGALCQSFCDDWYYACQADMIDPYIDTMDGAPFCKEDSLICSTLRDSIP